MWRTVNLCAELLTNATFDFIDEIERCDDAATLVESFQRFIRKFGMLYFMVGNPDKPGVPRDDRLWATTWPEEWLNHWSDQKYLFVDPVVRYLLTENEPVRWSQTPGPNNEPGARVLDEANEFRMRDGFAVPVHSRDGNTVAVSMGTEAYELGRRDEICLHMGSLYFYTKLDRLRSKSLALARRQPRSPQLTPRERECLSWVAAGKTDWEISQILNIAEQTVHEYVQNALIKLNATTRAQAVAIAISNKQIKN